MGEKLVPGAYKIDHSDDLNDLWAKGLDKLNISVTSSSEVGVDKS